jgi:hypothetical protein
VRNESDVENTNKIKHVGGFPLFFFLFFQQWLTISYKEKDEAAER